MVSGCYGWFWEGLFKSSENPKVPTTKGGYGRKGPWGIRDNNKRGGLREKRRKGDKKLLQTTPQNRGDT